VGVWGSGIFENDEACDLSADLEAALVKLIQTTIKGDLELFEQNRVLAAAELLSSLYQSTSSYLPPEVDVQAWKLRFLEAYDQFIPDADPVGNYAAERRGVIQAAFDRLATHVIPA
jgi:hypothetical protein